ncbi:MAG: nitroreductase family protein [Bacillota bacterium]
MSLQLQVDRWYAAISERHSTRSFRQETVDEEVLGSLAYTCGRSTLPGVRSILISQPAEKILRGLIGGYGAISGAQAFMAFVGDTEHPLMQENIGYLGEAMILEATRLQLGSCWVGGFFREEEVKRHIELKPSERVLCVCPVGYPMLRQGLKDILFKRLAHSAERKPLSQITTGLSEERWPEWVRSGLDAARIAPSAANRQPWLFEVADDAVTISIQGQDNANGKLSKRLDCGIAMLHFEIGARHAGAIGEWEHLAHPQVARFVKH